MTITIKNVGSNGRQGFKCDFRDEWGLFKLSQVLTRKRGISGQESKLVYIKALGNWDIGNFFLDGQPFQGSTL